MHLFPGSLKFSRRCRGKCCMMPGVTIILSTDALPGYALHDEIELYVPAGIPEVLRMATLTPTIVTPSSIRPSLSSLIPAWRPGEEHSRHPQYHHRDQGRKGLRSGRDRKSPRYRTSSGAPVGGPFSSLPTSDHCPFDFTGV